jgi:hypothetical protein
MRSPLAGHAWRVTWARNSSCSNTRWQAPHPSGWFESGRGASAGRSRVPPLAPPGERLRTGPLPLRWWVALFGGPLAAAAIAVGNARRLRAPAMARRAAVLGAAAVALGTTVGMRSVRRQARLPAASGRAFPRPAAGESGRPCTSRSPTRTRWLIPCGDTEASVERPPTTRELRHGAK